MFSLDMFDLENGHRWASITSTDQSGLLYIAAILTFIFSTLTLGARVYVKLKSLWWDDVVMVVAQVCFCPSFFITRITANLTTSDCMHMSILLPLGVFVFWDCEEFYLVGTGRVCRHGQGKDIMTRRQCLND